MASLRNFTCISSHVKVPLMEMLNSIAMKGDLALSQKNAIIRLLYKKGDHRLLKKLETN